MPETSAKQLSQFTERTQGRQTTWKTWEEALKSPETTLSLVERRMLESGKKLIHETDESGAPRQRTEGLGPNEKWFGNETVGQETISYPLTGPKRLWNYVGVLNRLRRQGVIKGFDFGIPYFRENPQTPLQNIKDTVAIFVISSLEVQEIVSKI